MATDDKALQNIKTYLANAPLPDFFEAEAYDHLTALQVANLPYPMIPWPSESAKAPVRDEEQAFFDGLTPLLLAIRKDEYPGLRSLLLEDDQLRGFFIGCLIRSVYEEEIADWIMATLPIAEDRLEDLREWWDETSDEIIEHYASTEGFQVDLQCLICPGEPPGSTRAFILMPEGREEPFRVCDRVMFFNLHPIDVAICLAFDFNTQVMVVSHEVDHGPRPDSPYHFNDEQNHDYFLAYS
ncbi:hypothetical protein [Alcanivorax sp. 1008]|uniref:hypothetical protein n=1 Tax=Alcanivorax sp. 1008 TaxID=2816853 RepID=UPI001D4E49F1|nr:hypothetical protein [Alcanivorax sp. 1008]MCC1496767.1 hypothetical protein [Alcanivorax sp. 1008]